MGRAEASPTLVMSIEIFSICIYIYVYMYICAVRLSVHISILNLRISKLFFKQRHIACARPWPRPGPRWSIPWPHEYNTDVGLHCQASASVSRDFKLLDPSALIWPNVDYVVLAFVSRDFNWAANSFSVLSKGGAMAASKRPRRLEWVTELKIIAQARPNDGLHRP